MTGTSVVAMAAVSPAVSAPNYVVTMFSDRGDYIGQGNPQEFDQTNATMTGSLSPSGISLSLSGGTSGTDWSLAVDPPKGSTFKVGYYTGVQRAVFRSAGHPGLDINGDGRGCNTVSGAFEVRRLSVSNGVITQLDLLYEQHCEGDPTALFGEIQIGQPRPAGLIAGSTSITWPAAEHGAKATPVPVYFRNPSAKSVHVGTVSLAGPAASQFSLSLNGCGGTTLAPGDSCDVFVGFTARSPGPQTAKLNLTLGSTPFHVQLDAPVNAGTTSLTMTSQPGDFIGAGQTYNFTGANSVISVSGSLAGLSAGLTSSDGQSWSVDMFPATGAVLAVGNYPNATRYPFNGTGNGLSVDGDSRGCDTLTGSFTVKQVAFSAVDNSLQHFDGTFVQHCEGQTPALTGELKYRSAPVITPPPGVGSLHVSSSSGVVSVNWVNPTLTRYLHTIVRIERSGTPVGVAPVAGVSGYVGTGQAVQVHGLTVGNSYNVVVYTVDKYGNVSSPVRQTIKIS
ncbi:MAG: hypothetical protein LBV34_27240 [Nocardiopsaceae bacterium]|jgi:hypothetical protein|nr:hypothetical protein [Nocardiopsaceae bacterium]